MRLKLVGILAGVVAVGSLAAVGTAHAVPYQTGNYGAYAFEGQYPSKTCGFRLKQQRTASFAGRTITLKYFYSGRCGSFARIDNAPQGCSAYLDRSENGGAAWASVSETVDPGINFAYTKVGNNLSGRVSRAAVACWNPALGYYQPLVRTNWF